MSDENSVCMLCNKDADPNSARYVFGSEKLCKLLSVCTGNLIAPDPSLSGIVCEICRNEAKLELEYQHQVYECLMNQRINYYKGIGDLERVTKLQLELATSKPSTYKRRTQQ